MAFVTNAALRAHTVTTWRRVLIGFVLMLCFAALASAGYQWIGVPLFLICDAYVLWSLGITFAYYVQTRNAGGLFEEPMRTKDLLFARLIIREVIRTDDR